MGAAGVQAGHLINSMQTSIALQVATFVPGGIGTAANTAIIGMPILEGNPEAALMHGVTRVMPLAMNVAMGNAPVIVASTGQPAASGSYRNPFAGRGQSRPTVSPGTMNVFAGSNRPGGAPPSGNPRQLPRSGGDPQPRGAAYPPIGAKQPPSGPKGVDPAHHNANVMVRDAAGDIKQHQRVVSGNMTPAEQALGFPRNTLASHTEARAITNIPLQAGETMTITGQFPPCPTCKGVMNRAARESGATIIYRWRENGVTVTWTAGN